jgi:hypothetical protein
MHTSLHSQFITVTAPQLRIERILVAYLLLPDFAARVVESFKAKSLSHFFKTWFCPESCRNQG